MKSSINSISTVATQVPNLTLEKGQHTEEEVLTGILIDCLAATPKAQKYPKWPLYVVPVC